MRGEFFPEIMVICELHEMHDCFETSSVAQNDLLYASVGL